MNGPRRLGRRPGPSPVPRDRFIEHHEKGLTATQLAELFGVTVRTIHRKRHEYGLAEAPRKEPKKVTPEFLARAEALLAEGMALRHVAEILDCSECTIQRHFPGRGWTPSEVGAFGGTIKRANRELGGGLDKHARRIAA